MKFRGHETFSIRKNWLAKGIRAIAENPLVFTDRAENPMDALGIGRNMVLSLRYWLKAVGIATEERSGRKMETVFTPLGKLISERDPFVEELGTLWLLHDSLTKNLQQATSWYFFFNEFNLSEFSKEDFVQALQNFDRMNGGETAVRSLEDDFECIVNTYLSRFKTSSDIDPEDNLESPFADLGLLDVASRGGKLYRKVVPPKRNIPPMVFLAALCDEVFPEGEDLSHSNGEIPLSEIQDKVGSPGKIFNLDAIALMDILEELENRDLVKIVRTAGLDVVRLLQKKSFVECVENFYSEMER